MTLPLIERRPALPARGAAGRRGALLGTAAAAAAWAWVALVDPNGSGHYPGCPLLALTGWSCPLCGGLRAAHALAHGAVQEALARNALFVVSLPLLAGVWSRWLWLRMRGSDASPVPCPQRWLTGAFVVLVGFGVARNTTWGHALAP